MPLRNLKIFIAVYETLNMTKASNLLYISQSAISQTIKQLEDHYKVKLFERFHKKLFHTEAAHKFYEFAISIVNKYNELDDYFLKSNNRQINIGASITVGTVFLPSIIKNFKSIYSDITVKVQINRSDSIERMVLNNLLSLGLVGKVENGDSQLVSENFFKEKLIIICSNKNSLSGVNDLSFDIFKNQSFILREKGSAIRTIFDKKMADRKISIVPEWESTSNKVIINAVSENLGISVLPEKLVERELLSGVISTINLKDTEFENFLRLIYLKDKNLDNASRLFIEYIKTLNPIKCSYILSESNDCSGVF